MSSHIIDPADRRTELPARTAVRASRRDALLCALVYVLLFAGLATVLRSTPGFPLDDSWIHLVIARNLARFHVFGFLPGQVTTGSTSLLWTAILFVEQTLSPRGNPVLLSALISAVILAAIGYHLRRMADEDSLAPPYAWCLALAPAISGNFLWLGLIGMEHLLFLLTSILVTRAWFQAGGAPTGNAGRVWLAAACFFFGLARPEAFFYVGLLIVWGWVSVRRHHAGAAAVWRAAFAAALGSALAILVTVAANLVTAHRILPQTLEGRRFLISSHLRFADRIDFLWLVAMRVFKLWSFESLKLLHGPARLAGIAVALAVVAAVLAGGWELLTLRAPRFLALALFGVLILGLYFVILPSAIHGGRYLAPLLLVFPCLILLGVKRLLGWTGMGQQAAWAIVLVVGLLSAARSVAIWRQATVADITQIEQEHGLMAAWIADHLPPEDIDHRQLAAFDIGRLGYRFHGDITDLGGLVDSTYLPYMRSARVGQYLARHHVGYLVLPGEPGVPKPWFTESLGLDPAHGVSLEPLHKICAPAYATHLAEFSTRVAAPCQELLRIRYSGAALDPETPFR